MKMLERLRSKNRTLLEMQIGILFWGILCQIAGLFFARNGWFFTKSIWFGILFAFVACMHMYRTLDKALWFGEDAPKLVTRGYVFRYVAAIVIFAVVGYTGALDVLVVFLGYMSLKVTAYLQPFTHKLCNKVFHETDPEPEALEEEDVSRVDEKLPETIKNNG